MKLYLLRRKDFDNISYDEFVSRLIRAKSATRAREIANQNVGDEGTIWQNPEAVECQIVFNTGEEGVIIENFNAG